MVHLILGLPGTGKSTYVRERDGLEFDIGGKNVSDEGKERIPKQLTKWLEVLALSGVDVYIDTYHEYFDIKKVLELLQQGKITITVAIPSEEDFKEVILPNIIKRGDSSDFINLYKKKFSSWRASWLKEWDNVTGVTIVNRYYD